MNSQRNPFSKFVLASAIASSIALSVPALASDSMSASLKDARMEGQIIGAYALNRHLNPFTLSVDVEGHTATLTGSVSEAIDKDLAGQIALGVDGVDKVDNRIEVDAHTKKKADGNHRDFGDVVSDATVTASVKSKLLWNEYTNGLDIDVDTKNGVVTLNGTAHSSESRELAGRLAENTQGVRDVENNLKVVATKADTASKAKKDMHEAGDVISDSWITSKVKTSLLFSKNVSGSDIDVTTRDGVVTLVGKVDSGAERDLAIEVTKDIRGVKSVKAGGLRVVNS